MQFLPRRITSALRVNCNGKAELALDQQEIDALKTKKLCHHCVGESYLSNEMRAQGTKLRCSYCGRVAKSYRISELAERIEEVFDQHYFRTSDQPTSWQYSMLADKESSYEWERDGVPVLYAIMDAADMPEAAANDIQRILEDQYSDFDAAATGEETEFSSDSYYEEKGTDDWRWQEDWQGFELSLKTEARFFSRTAASHLTSVFLGIDLMKTQDGRSLVVDAGPGTSLTALYRARVFQADEKLKEALTRPDRHVGSPPSMYANAGRMNAHGISVFYGANDPNVALAEVRPPVGSQVIVARFEIVRPVRLLDLMALSAVSTSGSIFDPTLAGCLERAMFLRRLSHRITRPVMPDDEPFEYIATQAVADFLATESTMQIDGVIFPSVQMAGVSLNILLFHKAARVEEMELPEGTEVSASLGQMYEEGWEVEYTVIEEVPSKREKRDEKRDTLSGEYLLTEYGGGWEGLNPDPRPSTLKIDVESVTVHIIQAVEFSTKEHKVHRHRWEKHARDL